jgi:hypothetical protein
MPAVADATRTHRLRAALLAMEADALRNAVRGIDEAMVRALPARSRPLISQLRRSGTPADLLRKLPDLTVISLLADRLTDDALAATRDALGDAADDPTKEQLLEALETVVPEHGADHVRLMLAVVAVGDAEAADICDDLLMNDERFALDAESPSTSSSTGTTKSGPDEDVLARRRERKEAEKRKKEEQRAKATNAQRPKHKRGPQQPPLPATVDSPSVPIVGRRQPTNLPTEFDLNDPLVGTVVLAHVPFEDATGGKTRPCVVIATSPDHLLVRPGYSDGGTQSRRWQSYELLDWAAAGLDKPSFISSQDVTIKRFDAGDPLGEISERDWNGLL